MTKKIEVLSRFLSAKATEIFEIGTNLYECESRNYYVLSEQEMNQLLELMRIEGVARGLTIEDLIREATQDATKGARLAVVRGMFGMGHVIYEKEK